MGAIRRHYWNPRDGKTTFVDETQFLYAFNEIQPAGVWTSQHAHPSWGELFFILSGNGVVLTEQGNFMVNRYRCLWIPSNVSHEFYMPTACVNRTLFIHDSVFADTPHFAACQMIPLTALLRELLLVVDDWRLDLTRDTDRRIGLVLVDCLKRSGIIVSSLCMPQERLLQEMCSTVLSAPGNPVSLEVWSRKMNLSLKSLSRLFARQTGLTLGRWIQLARLEHARILLEQGESVTTAALECGYSSVSSFITVFHRQFGVTPGVLQRDKPAIFFSSSSRVLSVSPPAQPSPPHGARPASGAN